MDWMLGPPGLQVRRPVQTTVTACQSPTGRRAWPCLTRPAQLQGRAATATPGRAALHTGHSSVFSGAYQPRRSLGVTGPVF